MMHALIAILIQIGLGLASGNWLLAGLAGAAVFIGREHAQAEQRWIERFGLGRRANMPWWGGFDVRVWNRKSLLDWIAPIAATLIIAFAIVRGLP